MRAKSGMSSRITSYNVCYTKLLRVLHLTAIAHEAKCDIDLNVIDKISKQTPQLCKLNPASDVFIEDLDFMGGIQAVLKELSKGGFINKSYNFV